MSLYDLIFYALGAEILVTTAIAVTRARMVHAVLFLALSFLGSAGLFYLLGAPFLGALEILIYAGGIMILFLFIVMMLQVEKMEGQRASWSRRMPAAVLAVAFVLLMGLVILSDGPGHTAMKAAMASPGDFGLYLFRQHWLSIEIVSLLLLVALLGALLLGRPSESQEPPAGTQQEDP